MAVAVSNLLIELLHPAYTAGTKENAHEEYSLRFWSISVTQQCPRFGFDVSCACSDAGCSRGGLRLRVLGLGCEKRLHHL